MYNIVINLSSSSFKHTKKITTFNLKMAAISILIVLLSINGLNGLILNGTEPSKYILDFPTNDNPLNIKVVSPSNLNYFLTIGDWGAPSGQSTYEGVQRAVANKMKSFYESQKAKGMNLLFVAAVGDNFYWTGQNCDEYASDWVNMYGTELTSVPCLAIMGNHDWGNSDQYALCAWNNPRYTSPSGIPYASNALNKDKKGCNPNMFYMPDFGYYYTINELNFELIGLDENYSDCPGGLGINYLYIYSTFLYVCIYLMYAY